MQELLDSQRQYQTLLRQVLNEHRQQVEALHQLIEQRKVVCPRCDYTAQVSAGSFGYGSMGSPTNENPIDGAEARNYPHSSSLDLCLSKWLQGLGIDTNSIDRIMAEEYTLEDILYHVTRDDLKRLHLR